jgi:DNA-binding NtrC family response regulator
VLDPGGEYHRLGEARRRTADLRVIAATNRAVEQIKPDLAARLPLELNVPPLNARREDVPLLARHLLRVAAARDPEIGARFLSRWDGERGEPRLGIALSRALVGHTYATHVRELEALLWTSLSSSPGDVAELTDEVTRRMGGSAPASRPAPLPPLPEEITAEVLRASMAKHRGVKDRVWRELGLPSRFALHRLLKKHGIGGGA